MQTTNETAGKRRQKELNDLREHFHSYDAHWLNMQSSTSATPLSVVRIRKPLFDFWGCDDLSLNINALDDFQSKIVKLFIDDDNAIAANFNLFPSFFCPHELIFSKYVYSYKPITN